MQSLFNSDFIIVFMGLGIKIESSWNWAEHIRQYTHAHTFRKNYVVFFPTNT